MFCRLALVLGLVCGLARAHVDLGAAHPGLALAVALPAGPLGSGAWRFDVEAGWAKVPAGQSLGPTHGGVVVDRAGLVYVSSDGPAGILVFSADGKFVRSLAPEFSGIHGLMLREERGREFIYAAHVKGNQVVKLALDGTLVWKIGCPTESGLYPALENFKPKSAGAKPPATIAGHDGRRYVVDGYRPTAVAVGPDGRIYVADGYGASVIHEYSADRKWTRVIGARGTGDGQFTTCHGLALDTRYGKPLLLVCDRENRRLVHLDLEGKFVRTLTTDLRRPCAVSILGEFAAVAELEGRVVVTDRAGKIVATLGDNPDKEQWAKFKLEPQFWQDGIFIAPHGLAFDPAGNLYVQDWNFTGRFTKLKRTRADRG
jgi:sugar lactone lactonase YvrE